MERKVCVAVWLPDVKVEDVYTAFQTLADGKEGGRKEREGDVSLIVSTPMKYKPSSPSPSPSPASSLSPLPTLILHFISLDALPQHAFEMDTADVILFLFSSLSPDLSPFLPLIQQMTTENPRAPLLFLCIDIDRRYTLTHLLSCERKPLSYTKGREKVRELCERGEYIECSLWIESTVKAAVKAVYESDWCVVDEWEGESMRKQEKETEREGERERESEKENEVTREKKRKNEKRMEKKRQREMGQVKRKEKKKRK